MRADRDAARGDEHVGARARARARRGARPRRPRPPAARSTAAPAAASVRGEHQRRSPRRSRPGPSGSPGRRSSVPVAEHGGARAPRAHDTLGTPGGGERADLRRRRAACRRRRPRRPPRRRRRAGGRCAPGAHALGNLDRRCHRSTTYSMGTTASAPSGTTPPVAIAIASPAPSARGAGRRPRSAPTIGSRPGVSADAHREAVHRRARERRQVDGGARGLGEHAARGRRRAARARPAAAARARARAPAPPRSRAARPCAPQRITSRP